MENILQAGQKANKKIAVLSKFIDSARKVAEDKKWKINSEKRDAVYKVEDKYNALLNLLDNDLDLAEAETKKCIEELSVASNKLDRFLKLKRLHEDGVTVKEIYLNPFEGRDVFLESLGSIIIDDTVCIRVYIKGQDGYRKKVNKFAVVLIGASIFGNGHGYENIVNYPRDFQATQGVNVCGENKNVNYRDDIAVVLKEAPTVEELKTWYNNAFTKDVTFGKYWNKEEHDKAVEDFNYVKENCNTPEWEKAYLEDRKLWYEQSVSNGVETKEYKRIVKRLVTLSL